MPKANDNPTTTSPEPFQSTKLLRHYEAFLQSRAAIDDLENEPTDGPDFDNDEHFERVEAANVAYSKALNLVRATPCLTAKDLRRKAEVLKMAVENHVICGMDRSMDDAEEEHALAWALATEVLMVLA